MKALDMGGSQTRKKDVSGGNRASRTAAKNPDNEGPKEDEIVITRTLDAPIDLVWRAWTDPERLKSRWGPRMFTSPSIKIDLRVGGSYLSCMRGPDGRDYWSTGVYREIIPLERLYATDCFSDENGKVVPAT